MRWKDRIKHPDIDPHIYGRSSLTNFQDNTMEKDVFLINSAGTIWHVYVKIYFTLIQKVTWNEL